MSDYTSKLNLYKVDPAIDGEDTFNIKSMMNDNWDKIDEKVGNMDEKLSGVEDNANNYNHPETHEADMIRIKDEGGKFTGDNVEDALGEVGSQLADITNVILASGTGTAIMLNMPSVTAYTANMKLTFIASADNSGGATTIDINSLGAKNLYKPNTTTAPNVKSGKAYTVWYNGTHFFLQASAEGNAVAGDVLAGKIFSNDDDTEIIGTMNLNNLIASNIRQGININGVVGTLIKGKSMATGNLYNLGQPINTWHKTISGLKFRPKIIVISFKFTHSEFNNVEDRPAISFRVFSQYQSFYKSEYISNASYTPDNYEIGNWAYGGCDARGSRYSVGISSYLENVFDDGFDIYIAPSGNERYDTANVEWVAIG